MTADSAADLVDKIEALQTELSATPGSSEVATAARKIERKMSDAGRLAIAAAKAKIAAAAKTR